MYLADLIVFFYQTNQLQRIFMTSRVQLSRLLAVAGVGYAVASVALTVVGVKGSNFSFTAEVTCKKTGAPDLDFPICDDAGKIKRYTNADDFLKAAAAEKIITGTVPLDVSIENVSALEPAPFTGDIVKRTQSTVATYAKRVTDITAKITSANTAIGLLSAVTAGEIALRNEKIAQRDSMVALKAHYAAEIIRLNAILVV